MSRLPTYNQDDVKVEVLLIQNDLKLNEWIVQSNVQRYLWLRMLSNCFDSAVFVTEINKQYPTNLKNNVAIADIYPWRRKTCVEEGDTSQKFDIDRKFWKPFVVLTSKSEDADMIVFSTTLYITESKKCLRRLVLRVLRFAILYP